MDHVTMSLADHQRGETHTVVRSILARRCPASLGASRDDLVQDAMVRISLAYRRDPSRTLNRNYLRAVALSVLRDALRRSRVRSGVFLDTSAVERACATGVADPERSALAREELAAIQRILDQNVACRRSKAAALHFLGYTRAEIAMELDVPLKCAENLIYRGVADLRRHLFRWATSDSAQISRS